MENQLPVFLPSCSPCRHYQPGKSRSCQRSAFGMSSLPTQHFGYLNGGRTVIYILFEACTLPSKKQNHHSSIHQVAHSRQVTSELDLCGQRENKAHEEGRLLPYYIIRILLEKHPLQLAKLVSRGLAHFGIYRVYLLSNGVIGYWQEFILLLFLLF